LITPNKIRLFPAIVRTVNSTAVNIRKYVVGESTLRNTFLRQVSEFEWHSRILVVLSNADQSLRS